MRAVVFREMLGLTKERARSALASAIDWLRAHVSTQTCRPGLSPHAPYSVRASLFRAAARLARRQAVPVAVHTAESPDELFLLGAKTGPFVDFLQELGVWDPTGLIDNYETLLGLFRGVRNVAFIHANYLILAAFPESVRASCRVLCPRTRAAFGFGGGPIHELNQPGVSIAIGTDSLASNPDLDVLAEIRFLHRLYPDVPGATLLRMATLSGAEALGWADEAGSLTPGKSADLVVVPLRGDGADPHRLLLGGDAAVSRVLFRGRWVV